MWALSPIRAPGRSRANGPMIAPEEIDAPSMWLKARIVTLSATVDARTEHDVRLDRDIAAELRVEGEEHGVGRNKRRAAEHRRRPPPRLKQPLRLRELRAIVDAEDILRGNLDGD